MKDKVLSLISKLDEIETALGNPNVLQDQNKFKELTQEHSRLTELKTLYDALVKTEKELADNKEMISQEEEGEFLSMLEDEVEKLEKKEIDLTKKLEGLLVPPDPRDNLNTIVEVRAGTGGDEAAIFVGDVVRMYKLFADNMGWKYELLSCTPSEAGGYREYIMVLSGANVHRFMQYEAGTHRVQRVPDTETQGRVHTSAITVAVFAEPTEQEMVKVNEADLRIDTFRSSGAGGQHVNTTDSAVRLTHIPTGIVVACQEERSQHKNKEKAMRYLQARIAEVEREKREKEIASTRSMQVGSGDRSERIRTYNFPQNRLTDHRINLTLHNLHQVIEGALEDVSNSLVSHFHQLKFQ